MRDHVDPLGPPRCWEMRKAIRFQLTGVTPAGLNAMRAVVTLAGVSSDAPARMAPTSTKEIRNPALPCPIRIEP